MQIIILPLGETQTNCYILHNDSEAVIFDPGSDAPKIKQVLADRGIKPLAIFLTHGHFDHIGAADELANFYKIPVYASELEKKLAKSLELNCSHFIGQVITANVTDIIQAGSKMNILGETLQILATPGHTSGSLSFYFENLGILISGDVIFKGGCGRYDLPTSNFEELKQSIKTIYALPSDTQILSGHGDTTTVADEREGGII